jgi:hypothetical protein
LSDQSTITPPAEGEEYVPRQITANDLDVSFEEASGANAGAVILRHPEQTPGPPYYAHFGRGFLPNDGQWAGLPFYRSPECVPDTFNLLNQFDPPAAFGCPLLIQGLEWWHDPSSDPFPYQTYDRARRIVPIYFVLWSELQDAIADDVLTLAELRSLPSLRIGQTRDLTHSVQNTNYPRDFGREDFSARGWLVGGGTFEFRYKENFFPETGEHVFPEISISFRSPEV